VQHDWAKNDVCRNCLATRHGYQGGRTGGIIYVSVDGARSVTAGACSGRAAGRASVTAKAEGWIRCEERMPEPRGKCVVAVGPGWKRGGICWFDGDGWLDIETSQPLGAGEVTHWMPLPPAPADPEPATKRKR
jgi:hypothetical protein